MEFRFTSVTNCKFIDERSKWGGPPGPRPTPPSAISRVMAEPDQGVRRRRGRPPQCELRD